MGKRSIVIWGAGRIGRGFIADLFHAAGYEITFVDQAMALIEQLNRLKKYPVMRARAKNEVDTIEVTDFQAFHTDDSRHVQEAIDRAGILAVAVFPKNLAEVAKQLQVYILGRLTLGTPDPLDILLCTNLIHAGPIFKDLLYAGLDESGLALFEKFVGIVETLIIRISPDPQEDLKPENLLFVLTNGYPELPVDERGFKGTLPDVSALRPVKDMHAEEMRKIYTYNMLHAVLAYQGAFAGHKLLVECLEDPWVRAEGLKALFEISQALQKEFHFANSDMEKWNAGVVRHTDNPLIRDSAARSAADPIRKLKRDDRLLGPALLCLKHGIEPKAILGAVGAALHYRNEEDLESIKVGSLIVEQGIEKTIAELCGLTSEEQPLIRAIVRAYERAPLEYEWSQKARQAYDLGFQYEKQYHGCGQSVVAATMETLGTFDETVFCSATGLCGGIGLVNDATCSAYTGGVMAIGVMFPRRREFFDGDKSNKYLTFALCQELREKMIAQYGSIQCAKVHEKKYGRAFDLRDAKEKEAFEAAGAHEQGCTEVVANCARWTVELLAEGAIDRTLADKKLNGKEPVQPSPEDAK